MEEQRKTICLQINMFTIKICVGQFSETSFTGLSVNSVAVSRIYSKYLPYSYKILIKLRALHIFQNPNDIRSDLSKNINHIFIIQ